MKASVYIKGIKPILIHRFNIETLSEVKKPKSGTSGNDPEEWRTTFFHDDGKLYIPDTYISSSLRSGAIYTKVGRGTIQKTWMGAVQIDEEKIYFNREMPKNWEDIETKDFPRDPVLPVFLDVRMVSNPNTKGRNVRYRIGLGKGWELKFTLDIDDSLVSKQTVKKVIEDTGKMSGIADGRTLGFGRYELLECEFS